MVAPTCFGITLPSLGSVSSVFWKMLNWGAVDRILWMGVLCLVTWCAPRTTSLDTTRHTDRWDLIRRLKGCMKNKQIHQLFIQFINYVWQLLCVSALHCHLQGAFVVRVVSSDVVRSAHHAHPQYSIDCFSIEHLSEGIGNAPWRWQCNAETRRSYNT